MTDYRISEGKIQHPTNPGVIRVWSAFTPTGERIMNGEKMFFDDKWAAADACFRHEAEMGRAAA